MTLTVEAIETSEGGVLNEPIYEPLLAQVAKLVQQYRADLRSPLSLHGLLTCEGTHKANDLIINVKKVKLHSPFCAELEVVINSTVESVVIDTLRWRFNIPAATRVIVASHKSNSTFYTIEVRSK